jgi:AMP nucleosidase
MSAEPQLPATDLEAFDDADAAMARVEAIYATGAERVRRRFASFSAGDRESPGEAGYYPYLAITVGPGDIDLDPRTSYGQLSDAGSYGTTLTRPDLFRSYYREQIGLLLRNHRRPVLVGVSDTPMALPFVIEEATANVTSEDVQALQAVFDLPDLATIDDSIANGDRPPPPGQPKPLALFPADRVDFSLVRLFHYTGTAPEHFQRFVLFTNYQRYVEEFVELAMREMADGDDYDCFVAPGNVVTQNPRRGPAAVSGAPPPHLPQMPAYHLVRADRRGITLINIGVGPSNAKTITDHVAVLRPHCWLMIGHCGGLRHTQRLGDYVLAHAYVREDHVLDRDLPVWVPVPPIAEIQIALTQAVAEVTGLDGRELKTRLRTGTVFTTDNRDWELRHLELAERFNQSRAIAVDMESATIAANGFRLRVPYGTLLCVSDKPVHGEIKLPGMANIFYRSRVGQHLSIGIRTLRGLREAGVEALHSRKLRSYDEPPFR